MPRKGYTPKQLQIINSEIDLDQITGNSIASILKTAIQICDEETIERFTILQQEKKNAYLERNRILAKERARRRAMAKSIKEYLDAAPNPRSLEYTKREKSIISGIIPYEQTKAHDYARIYSIAKALKDNVLMDKMIALYEEKSRDQEEYYKACKKSRRKLERIKEKSRQNDPNWPFKVLELWEIRVLTGEISYHELKPKDIEQVIKDAKKEGNEIYIALADLLEREQLDPAAGLKFITDEEILKALNEHTIMPIEWPHKK